MSYICNSAEKIFTRVDNIPLAFALPIGLVGNFGHVLDMGFDQAFSQIGAASSYNYYHYGTVFGTRLQKEFLRAKVRDSEFISNMGTVANRNFWLKIGYSKTLKYNKIKDCKFINL